MKKGFTLIELIIVVGLMVVAALTALVNLSGAKYGRDLANTMREVAAVIRDTQNNAITQKDGKRWGIRFTNSVSGAHKYEVFSSSSYATSVVERLFSLSRGIKFSEPGAGLYFDQVFEAVTGKPSASKYISLVNNRRDGLVGDILLHQSGRLTTKIESGLVGYWHFDEGTSTSAYDSAGFGNTGTLYSSSTICSNPPTSGCPTWQAASNCKAGTCLSFDGTDDYVQLSNLGVNTASGQKNTVTFWMYWNGVTNDMPFGFTSYDLYFSSGAFGFNHGCGDVWGVSSSGLANKWVYVAAVFNNNDYTQEQLYLDGVQQSLSQMVGTSCNRSVSTSAKVAVWQNGGGSGGLYNFSGKIDEVRIYNRALSATEILNLYNDLK